MPTQASFLASEQVEFDPERVTARQDAIVRNIFASIEPVSVLVLGGSHDLSESIRKLAADCEYVRVSGEAYLLTSDP